MNDPHQRDPVEVAMRVVLYVLAAIGVLSLCVQLLRWGGQI